MADRRPDPRTAVRPGRRRDTLRTIGFYLRAAAGSLGFLAALLYCHVRLAVGRTEGLKRDTARRMAAFVCPPLGLRVVASGTEHLLAQPCVYVSNHQSFLDYPILAAIFPDRTAIIGRSSMRGIPLVGWLFEATGNLLIPREDPARAYAVLDDAARRIRAGQSIWIFPEGTRGAGTGSLLPFKRGAFRLAVAAGVPVVPVVVAPLKPDLDLRARVLRPTTITVRVLEPTPTSEHGQDSVALLVQSVRERMQEALEQPTE